MKDGVKELFMKIEVENKLRNELGSDLLPLKIFFYHEIVQILQFLIKQKNLK